MKKLYLITLLSLMLCASCMKKAETDPEVIAMRGLVNRVVPEYSEKILLQRLENDTIDRFEIEMKRKKLVIRGNNANSMAVGLNHYLKYYCMAQYSWFKEEPLQIPAAMPMVPEKVSLSARVPDRFFLNYCTFGYTLPWWDCPWLSQDKRACGMRYGVTWASPMRKSAAILQVRRTFPGIVCRTLTDGVDHCRCHGLKTKRSCKSKSLPVSANST